MSLLGTPLATGGHDILGFVQGEWKGTYTSFTLPAGSYVFSVLDMGGAQLRITDSLMDYTSSWGTSNNTPGAAFLLDGEGGLTGTPAVTLHSSIPAPGAGTLLCLCTLLASKRRR